MKAMVLSLAWTVQCMDGAGCAIVIHKVKASDLVEGSWVSSSINLDSSLQFSSSVPLRIGCTDTVSFETETYALLVARCVLKRHLHRCLILSDAKSLLDTLAGIVSFSDPHRPLVTSREVRNKRSSQLIRLLVHEWTKLSSATMPALVISLDQNCMSRVVAEWESDSRNTGKFSTYAFSIGKARCCHIKSHQADGISVLERGRTNYSVSADSISQLAPCRAALSLNSWLIGLRMSRVESL